MTEPSLYNFDFKEAAVALIKHQGIRKGLWMVGFEISLGSSSVEAKPGACMQISRIQLIRQTPETNPNLVDAAKVNPGPPD